MTTTSRYDYDEVVARTCITFATDKETGAHRLRRFEKGDLGDDKEAALWLHIVATMEGITPSEAVQRIGHALDPMSFPMNRAERRAARRRR